MSKLYFVKKKSILTEYYFNFNFNCMDYTKALFGSKMLLACMLATQLGGGK